MIFKFYFMIFIVCTTLVADTKTFNQLILENQIDLKSKSLKSWMRIFNSEEKIKFHGFRLSNAERFTMLKGLKMKQNKSKKRYSRRLR